MDAGWINVHLQCEYALEEYYVPGDTGWFDRCLKLENGKFERRQYEIRAENIYGY